MPRLRDQAFLQYYRCPEQFSTFVTPEHFADEPGYFQFGRDTICYGLSSSGTRDHLNGISLPQALERVSVRNGVVELPFHPTQVIEGLRREQYLGSDGSGQPDWLKRALRTSYYSLRPFLSLAVRRQLQRLNHAGWSRIQFPHWPVDLTVDQVLERLLILQLKCGQARQIPFVWFWPDGAAACLTMTHDVETPGGRDFCPELMDINDAFSMKASFQIVPEERYAVSASFLDRIRHRGFEVNIQDLNHDGRLFWEREEFLRRARKINAYARQYRAAGFRAAVLYRNPNWYDALEFSYDMSIPNVGHLDPQRGGCCTVMPYFIGNVLELPLTTTQDYTLFYILNEHSLDLWKAQTNLILAKNGLASFLIHPDYIRSEQAKSIYCDLLAYLRQTALERGLWMALPREIDRWWRQRSQMQLFHDGCQWRIEGAGSERARVAYASLSGGKLTYHMEPGTSRFQRVTSSHGLRLKTLTRLGEEHRSVKLSIQT